MKKCILLPILSCFISFAFMVGCSSSSEGTDQTSASTGEPIEITVAAASDLRLAFTQIGEQFEKETDSKVTFSFGSTGQLADQIENGAPFDVFAAANIKFVDQLREKGKIIPDTQQLYALGRIGLATIKDSKYQVAEMNDLLNPEIKKISIANPDHAPYGLAAKQALESAGIWDNVKDKLVYGKNITDTLTLIETGNVDAGIIALSLVKKDEMNFNLIDDQFHAPLKQAIGVVNGTKQEALARKFIDFVNGPKGSLIMERYGFRHPKED